MNAIVSEILSAPVKCPLTEPTRSLFLLISSSGAEPPGLAAWVTGAGQVRWRDWSVG